MRVTHYSESPWSIKGHGVHTAFEDAVRSLKEAGIDVGVNTWGRDEVLHVHTVGPVAALRALVHRGPKVTSAHCTLGTVIGSLKYDRLLVPPFRRYFRWFYNRFDVVLCLSDDNRREVEELGVSTRLVTLPNIVTSAPLSDTEDDRRELRERLGVPVDRPVVVCVAQLQPRKNIEAFVEVARAIPEATFVWVGGQLFGPASAGTARIQELQAGAPENVIWTGHLSREGVGDHLAASDVFFFPSTHETFGMAVIEAANAGLPLALTDLPVYEETLGSFGIEYLRAGSVEAHVANVRSLLAAGPQGQRVADAKALGERREKESVTRLVEVYEDLAARR